MKRPLVLSIAVVCGLYTALAGATSLVNPETYRSLYSDRRAYGVGDSLTILVLESAAAESRAESSTDRSFDINAGLLEDDDTPRAGLNLSRETVGEGATTRVGSLRAQLSARVEKVLDTGDFVVRGEQTITINGEQQRIALEGIARPWDITSDNTVLSSRLLNPRIEFLGEGWVDGAQRPGVLERLARFLGL
jgi:flagellar L-ring protein FlgH